MRPNFLTFVDDLRLGESITCGELTFVPLFLTHKSSLEYVMLDAASSSGLIQFSEVDLGGEVPRMAVRNDSDLPVFVVDGTILVGSKQNRVVNISLLLPPLGKTIIPVSCVERGRWFATTTASAPSEQCDPYLRRKMLCQTMKSLHHQQPVNADQVAVWNHVGEVLRATQTANATQDYCAAFSAPAHPVSQGNRLRLPRGASGVAVLDSGRVISIDVFDKPATLETCWQKLARSTTISPLRSSAKRESPLDLKRFILDTLNSKRGEFTPVGLGVHHRFENLNAVGNALIYQNHLAHLAIFGDDRRSGEGPRCQTTDSQPARRPWWKFWR